MVYDLTYLSLGAGVQSSALLLMSNKGILNVPKADIAIFSDTQAEPPYVYEHLEKLHELSSIPIITTTAGNLREDSINDKFVSIPVFMANDDGDKTIMRRQCTREYKIEPIQKAIRKHLGYRKGQRVKEKVRALVGISIDEAIRMKPSRFPYITNTYPLVDARINRQMCLNILQENGWSIPQKSACTFCPYRPDSSWKEIKENSPVIWEEIVDFDRRIRHKTRIMDDDKPRPVFLHASLQPIEDVDFTRGGQLEFTIDGFNNECEGMCGV
mgnify:CR=1 FL=1|tara:strand:+ start:161 stop:970 length:810 start_codon:yes stop_codon:yes gene_type:complete